MQINDKDKRFLAAMHTSWPADSPRPATPDPAMPPASPVSKDTDGIPQLIESIDWAVLAAMWQHRAEEWQEQAESAARSAREWRSGAILLMVAAVIMLLVSRSC